jgi:cell division protein FtsB
MRWLAGVLLLLLAALQYRLWVGDGSLAEVHALREEISAQKAELLQLQARNQSLEAEVLDLREGLDALEERARSELGMIKQGEMFLQVIQGPDPPVPESSASSSDPKLPAQKRDAEGGAGQQEVAAEAGRKP